MIRRQENLRSWSFSKRVDFDENIFHLIDKLYNDKTQYFEGIIDLKKLNNNLEKENKNLEEKINIFLERKKTKEQKLFSKFVSILNEKKQHIQHLNELLLAFRKGRPSVNPAVSNKGQKRGHEPKTASSKNIKRNMKASSESDYNSGVSDSSSYNTDNEDSYHTDEAGNKKSSIPATKNNLPVPGTSKNKYSFVHDSPETLFTFSKRIRTDSNLNLNVHLPEKRNTDSMNRDSKIDAVSSEVKNELNPTVNFSTQDLLDNL